LRDGKGTSIKAHDYRVAAMCVSCHHSIDNGNNLSKDERREIWELAHRLTIGYMFEHDMIGVLK
jgi:cytochrome c553